MFRRWVGVGPMITKSSRGRGPWLGRKPSGAEAARSHNPTRVPQHPGYAEQRCSVSSIVQLDVIPRSHQLVEGSNMTNSYYASGDLLKEKNELVTGVGAEFPQWAIEKLDLADCKNSLDVRC